MREMPTAELTRTLERALEAHQPPLVRGRRIKLRYAHQGGRNPPRIIIHGNQTASVPEAYRRYLANVFRERFDLYATPVAIEFRTDVNPYDPRQSPRRAAAAGGGRNNAGSTKTRLSATPKCRCGPVTRPVAPTLPISSPACDVLALMHRDRGQVAVHGDQTLAVVDQHRVAVEEIIAGIDDPPGGGGVHRRAAAGRDVHAGVRVARLVVEYAPRAEGTGADPRDRRRSRSVAGRLLVEGRERRLQRACSRSVARQILRREIDLRRWHAQPLHHGIASARCVNGSVSRRQRPRAGSRPHRCPRRALKRNTDAPRANGRAHGSTMHAIAVIADSGRGAVAASAGRPAAAQRRRAPGSLRQLQAPGARRARMARRRARAQRARGSVAVLMSAHVRRDSTVACRLPFARRASKVLAHGQLLGAR